MDENIGVRGNGESMKYTGNAIAGWMKPAELQWLYDRAQKMDTVLEIGSWKGRSTHALLSGCKGTVFAVDHFQGSAESPATVRTARRQDVFSIFRQNVGQFPNLVTLRMSSADAAKSLSACGIAAFDMVFIDGAHSFDAVQADVRLWEARATKLLCGHDFGRFGVGPALSSVFGDGKVERGPGSIWMVEK